MLAGLGGCTSYQSPQLSVAGAVPTERTDDGAAMLFTLDARNDNDVALPLRTVEYSVELDGRPVFSGTRSGEATLRQQGTQQVRLPAVVALTPGTAASFGGRQRYRLSGSMFYVTPGQLAEVLFDAGVRTPSVPFSFEGEIDFAGATFTPSSPQPAQTSASEAPAAQP